jgi:pilus assembly protein CpaE
MNRATQNVGLKTREVEAALKVKISHELPSDQTVPLTVNRGTPAVLAEPRSDFSKAIFALAKQVAPQSKTAPAPKRHRNVLSLVRG